jgi:hypothetical protein
VHERIVLKAGTRLVVAAGAVVLLSFAAYTSVRVSYAEFLFHKNTLAPVQRAIQLDPDNGRYHAWLAELLENEGRDASAALERAARLSPLDSRVWMRRGLAAEANGNRMEAERLLLHAAAIDHLMEPRWTLMNFYFRGREEDPFWRWARETFEISYGDRTPLFDLCWRVREDAAVIESRALPAKYLILFQFVGFLLAKERLQDAAALAERILPEASATDIDTYLYCVSRLVKSGAPAAAVRLWNAMCDRGLLPLRRLNPASGESLTNGGFEHDPVRGGFDWNLPAPPGVQALRTSAPSEMKFTFNGQQTEECDVMSQTVPLQPMRRYRMRFSYRTAGVPAGSGLRIRTLDQATPDLSSEEWKEESLIFAAGPRETADIVLEYRRPPGLVRMEGTLELRGIALGFAE